MQGAVVFQIISGKHSGFQMSMFILKYGGCTVQWLTSRNSGWFSISVAASSTVAGIKYTLRIIP